MEIGLGFLAGLVVAGVIAVVVIVKYFSDIFKP
jgi:uncharacterized membrane-anchored protein